MLFRRPEYRHIDNFSDMIFTSLLVLRRLSFAGLSVAILGAGRDFIVCAACRACVAGGGGAVAAFAGGGLALQAFYVAVCFVGGHGLRRVAHRAGFGGAMAVAGGGRGGFGDYGGGFAAAR